MFVNQSSLSSIDSIQHSGLIHEYTGKKNNTWMFFHLLEHLPTMMYLHHMLV